VHVNVIILKCSNKISPLLTNRLIQAIDVVLPTYRIKPEENTKFYPSKAKQIAQEILEEELADKVRDLVTI
jgi:hypothetical protein